MANQEYGILKIRLFCFLLAIFILAGLLLPVGVYAVDKPTVGATTDVAISTETDTPASDSCNLSKASAVTETETVAVEAEVTLSAGDSAGKTDECQDDEGTYSRVSWNS